MKLPRELEEPIRISGKVALKVMVDLTAYLAGPSEAELEFLVDLYERTCPRGRMLRYKIAELEYWPSIARPDLTASGRAAAMAGIPRPYLEPVRRRIREARAFEIQFWDGVSIDAAEGSWSFACRRIHLRTKGLHAFVRFLIPLHADIEVIRRAALALAENVELYSGHGGLVFVYDPWLKENALDAAYALARRFWGVDIEDLNRTLPLMKQGIKGVNWTTLVGNAFASVAQVRAEAHVLDRTGNVEVHHGRHALHVLAGPCPVAGDQHRPDSALYPYYAVARALAPLFVSSHPDFSSERFVTNGDTMGWIRRFIDPDGWRQP